MAFNFVVEIGNADPDATSYASTDFASTYTSMNMYVAAAWAALSEDEAEKLLSRASMVLDTRVLWNGRRLEPDSGLKWPRCGVYDCDGYCIEPDVIPIALQQATVEFASYLMDTDWTAPQDRQGLREIKVDVIDIKYDSTYFQTALPDTVRAIIEQNRLGECDSGQRPAFKKIVRS